MLEWVAEFGLQEDLIVDGGESGRIEGEMEGAGKGVAEGAAEGAAEVAAVVMVGVPGMGGGVPGMGGGRGPGSVPVHCIQYVFISIVILTIYVRIIYQKLAKMMCRR